MTFLLQKGIFSRTKDQDFDMSFDGQVGKIHWRRESLPTPVFLGFPGGSAGKESTCNAGDLGSIPGLGRSPGEGIRLPTPVFWPGEFHGLYRPWGRKESDTTEQLSLHFTSLMGRFEPPQQVSATDSHHCPQSPLCGFLSGLLILCHW